MVSINQLTLGFFILQIYVSAAPSETTVEKEVTNPTPQDGPKLDDGSAPTSTPELNKNNSTQTQRQKRYYNLAFASANSYYPDNRRGSNIAYATANSYNYPVPQDIGAPGLDDSLAHIHRHLLQIAAAARQPPPPPPPPLQFPFWLPIFYIPQTGCNCKSNKKPKPKPNQNTTGDPGISTRFPDLEDERLNWGIVNNNDDNSDDYDVDEDFSRPISFDPITVNTPMKRPPPPVEHGSSQGDQTAPQGTTTIRPRPPPPQMGPPRTDEPQNIPPTAGFPFASPYPTNFTPPERPTTCDAAILSCCHQAQVTLACFAIQRCPDPGRFSQGTNPCDPSSILRVVEKYQKFYGQRNG